MPSKSWVLSAALLNAFPLVAGHGYVREVTLGTTSWPGYNPFFDSWWQPPPERIIRKVPGIGPLLTYMARAPYDITKWNPGTEAVWFKVAHSGKSDDGKWAAPEMFGNHNGTYTFRIPKNILPGQYLIRHEWWVVRTLPDKYPGVQIYPVCVQIEVTGSGTAFPTSFVSFPGEYKPETPGMIFDVWNGKPYPLPGPEV
ncbi:hypothetical protein FA15DRAFT_679653 [Coprinopsis marcescibilis]|uniref:lytic cellulose monooxygenase (C4-dehydrogenating) n=1 Tax=Coprinopsis marcescibilis TaxID=230819 RepID=A0A5C3LDC3_COPMA|nr:hypothetical protein FA15DRAFT_679653 [Coprinopsis marcescibilis]